MRLRRRLQRLSMFDSMGPSLHAHSVGLAVLGIGLIALCAATLVQKRRLALARHRRPTRIPSAATSFARLLESHGFDPAVALATYCYLDESRDGTSSIHPGDSLERDLGLGPEQIEHTLLALMALLGRKPALEWNRQPIGTVEDLIGVLQAAPQADARGARVAA